MTIIEDLSDGGGSKVPHICTASKEIQHFARALDHKFIRVK